jgi:uncharacterized protein with ParB-like and HNH nuclease domain
MDANAVPLLAVFEKKMQLEVPLFQRQYVWNREQQWEPLWDDIERKFSEYLDGRKDAPVHFLGAMVLDQKQTPTTHVEKRQVIDGQQRLTTIQIFLAAFRDLCREHECDDLADECERYTLNKGMMANPEVDLFKVWPTQLDRSQFSDVIASGSRERLEETHPVVRKKYKRKPEPRPRMIEAYLFFYAQLAEFFLEEDCLRQEAPLSVRLEECFQSLRNALKVVVIDLQPGDDAQVIFETLNARGEPLLPADLLRNYIFLRAGRNGEPQEELYRKYWQWFDDEFWRKEVKQGRLLRPRSDLFMQHFLASRQTADIPIKHLFVEYKFWIETQRPFGSVADELATLAKQGRDFRRILDPSKDDPIYGLAIVLDAFDVRTAYPLLLTLLDRGATDIQWKAVSRTLESYLVRRAVCGLTTKNYNRIFLGLTRALRREGMEPERLSSLLSEQVGESVDWPSDEDFREAWLHQHAYRNLNSAKIVYILKCINGAYVSSKMESVSIEGPLTVEHLLPQNWVENWPLRGGRKGLSTLELTMGEQEDELAIETRRRNAALQTLGNLTILTRPLNSSVSNGEWTEKKRALLEHSLLPINKQLYCFDVWDEDAIYKRGEELFEVARKLWPHGE